MLYPPTMRSRRSDRRPTRPDVAARRVRAACAGLLGAVLVGCVPGVRPGGDGPGLPADPPLRLLEPAEAGKFDEGFDRRLSEAPPDAWFHAMLDLREQVDLPALVARTGAAGLSKAARREAVLDALETVASRGQARLDPTVRSLRERGEMGLARGVAVVNRLVVEGTARGILELAAHDEVARVLPEWTSDRRAGATTRFPEPTAIPGGDLGEAFESWALDAMGVRALWDRGLDGRGVVVASIDTGVHGTHEQFRGRSAPDGRGWFDPVENRPEPYDSHGHGTTVLGLAVGGNPAGRSIGIAPAARWAAALGNFRNVYSRVRMTLAADWVLRTARPDVLVNAWSDDSDPCATFDLAFIDAWKASGIFVVFPAGNAGPGRATGESPAQMAGVLPDGAPVFSVAALAPDDRVYDRSSRGPSRCGSPRFPTLAAPGAKVPFAFPGGEANYGVGDGTSLAAGLVAGAAALLLQAEPELSPDEVEAALIAGARDLATPGPDDDTGFGAIDLPAALAAARRIARGR